MKVINLSAERRQRAARAHTRKSSACIQEAWGERLKETYAREGRELADLAHPLIEPFRICEPELEQHLRGAFLRWQLGQIKAAHDDHGAEVVGTALTASLQAFTDRMIELQLGFDPNDGGQAA